MASIEVDETELQNLRAQVGHLSNYEKVFKAISGNADSKTLLHAAIKKVSPNTPIPEFDTRAAMHGVSKQLQETVGNATKKIDDFLEGQKKREVENDLTTRVTSGRDFLRRNGMQKEGIEAVEKLMQEEGIASYAAALNHFRVINPPEEMSVPGMQRGIDLVSTGSPISDEEERKLLFAGSNATAGDKFVRTMIPKILAEVRGQTRAA